MHAASCGSDTCIPEIKNDVNAADEDGNTALIHATIIGGCSTIQMLIQSGANVNQFNLTGQTSLMLAAGYADIKLV